MTNMSEASGLILSNIASGIQDRGFDNLNFRLTNEFGLFGVVVAPMAKIWRDSANENKF